MTDPFSFRMEEAGFCRALSPASVHRATTRKLGHLQRLLTRSPPRRVSRGILRIVDQRAVARPFDRGEFLNPRHLGLGCADTGDAGAFVSKQEFRVIPALVSPGQRDYSCWHFHVVEKHPRSLRVPPSMVTMGRVVMPGASSCVDQQERGYPLAASPPCRCVARGRRSSSRNAPASSRSSDR